MIKQVLFIFLFFSVFFAEAQYNSQFNRRQSMQPRQPRAAQQPRAPKIDVIKYMRGRGVRGDAESPLHGTERHATPTAHQG